VRRSRPPQAAGELLPEDDAPVEVDGAGDDEPEEDDDEEDEPEDDEDEDDDSPDVEAPAPALAAPTALLDDERLSVR
jgi:hypothetical protein